jgi:hypothetical protein
MYTHIKYKYTYTYSNTYKSIPKHVGGRAVGHTHMHKTSLVEETKVKINNYVYVHTYKVHVYIYAHTHTHTYKNNTKKHT